MKNVYGYIRVSDVKQMEGVSLTEQKRIIIEFAQKNNLNIIHFYEENKTAAKRGRPLFDEMLRNLKNKKAEGVIYHKIDRSARNLHDWAAIGDLIDMNIEVFFAHESLNMNERGGRLSADIQAVMASDYVRNLRQETIKGLYGRLKQGYYPWKAPIGYLNNGKGKLKTIDPVNSILIKKLFELYLNGEYNVRTLSKEMENRGLRNSRGTKVCKNGITKILKNPFYIGYMKVKGKLYEGNHEPIIDVRIFKDVQKKIKGRFKSNVFTHNYLFRKQVKCSNCNYVMSGEKQKGHVYYRCQTKGCPTKSLREDVIEDYTKRVLKTMSLSKEEISMLQELHIEEIGDVKAINKRKIKAYTLQKQQLIRREKRLLDIYLEEGISKEQFENQRNDLLISIKEYDTNIEKITMKRDEISLNIDSFLELCKTPLKIYDSGIQEEKREILEIITSNLTVDRRKVMFSMVSPYRELAFRDLLTLCALKRTTIRKLPSIIAYMDKNTSPVIPKAMNKVQIKEFYDFLIGCSHELSRIKKLKNYYELPTNNSDTQ